MPSRHAVKREVVVVASPAGKRMVRWSPPPSVLGPWGELVRLAQFLPFKGRFFRSGPCHHRAALCRTPLVGRELDLDYDFFACITDLQGHVQSAGCLLNPYIFHGLGLEPL